MELNTENLLKFIIFSFFLVFVAILFPEIQNTINNLDTSSWSFTGAQGVAAVLPALPYIFIVVCVIPLLYVLKRELD